MDSLTHIVLGAAIGEAVLGRRLDRDDGIHWHFIPRQEDKLTALDGDSVLTRLRRLTRDWYTVERDGDALVITDMRYGTGTEWRDDGAQPWFAFRLIDTDDGLLVERIPCGSDFSDYGDRLHALFMRMLGDSSS